MEEVGHQHKGQMLGNQVEDLLSDLDGAQKKQSDVRPDTSIPWCLSILVCFTVLGVGK